VKVILSFGATADSIANSIGSNLVEWPANNKPRLIAGTHRKSRPDPWKAAIIKE
jgi:hypothetical protein